MSVIDTEGNIYATFEKLSEVGIERFKLVCEHEVEIADYLQDEG